MQINKMEDILHFRDSVRCYLRNERSSRKEAPNINKGVTDLSKS